MNGGEPIKDLTRWNRIGLERFRYVDANAATHLEDVRKALHARFPNWPAMKDPDLPDQEKEIARLKRLVEQLYSDRQDWGYEITRAFCRALHITTEHIDAFANEGYLQTATQWESLRRLVAMIGYVPRPQSSSATPLAILAPEENPPATLPKGTAIKNVPTATVPALLFETEMDLLVDPALNCLRLEGWNINPETFDTPFDTAADWPAGDDSKIDVGQVAILIETSKSGVSTPHPVKIEKVEISTDPAGASIKLEDITGSGLTPERGAASLVAAPKSILTPILNGPTTIKFGQPHGLGIGETIYLTSGSVHRFGVVEHADKLAVTLVVTGGFGALGVNDDIQVYRTRRLTKEQKIAHGDVWYLSSDPSASAYLTYYMAGSSLQSAIRITAAHKAPATDLRYINSTKLIGGVYQSAEEIVISDPLVDELVGIANRYQPQGKFEFGGSPPKLGSADWLMAEDDSGNLNAVRIASIERGDGDYTINLVTAISTASNVAFFHAEFQETLRPLDYNINKTPLEAADLVPHETSWPAGLVAGRDIIFENMDGGGKGGTAALVTGFDPAAGALKTDLKAADYSGFTIGNLVIRANIVIANHGETMPLQILGNGDASQTSQAFVFDTDDVTHVSDPASAGGVRADIEVWAGDVRFTQVDELRNSEPTDTHFHARLNEDAHLVLTFGDGLHGRRLPTGINNVQIRHRVGGGESGNVAAYTLSEPAGKSALIEEVRQPIAASGGGAAEPPEDLRRNAPASVQAMNRAVSLRDYENLANRYAGVWHAVAFEEKRAGREGDVVVVAVMPAGAARILGTLGKILEDSLETRGLPGVPVEIRPYVPARPALKISLLIDQTRYVVRDVLDAVRSALLSEFQPKNRRPGRPLHRSEIVAVIENVRGVTSSVLVELSEPVGVTMRRVRRGGEDAIWSLWPEPDGSVFIDQQSLFHLTVIGEAP